MMLGAVMHQDRWVNLKRMKNTAVLRFWHLYLVFIHANRVSCSLKTTKQDTMPRRQCREGRLCCSFSASCFSRGHPTMLRNFLLMKVVSNWQNSLQHWGILQGAFLVPQLLLRTGKTQGRGRALASPLPAHVPPVPSCHLRLSLVPYHHLLTGLLAHSEVCFFFILFLILFYFFHFLPSSLLYWLIL